MEPDKNNEKINLLEDVKEALIESLEGTTDYDQLVRFIRIDIEFIDQSIEDIKKERE